jgi:hypothetical protein
VWPPTRHLTGGLAGLGGVLAAVAAIPTRWFGPVPTDSYVFDPPRFSALWIERAVVPWMAMLAAGLCLAGLLALFGRDRDWMAKWHRWLAVVAVIGAAVGTLATILLVSTAGGGTADPTVALNAIVGAGFALLALALLVPGLLSWGVGYVRSGRPLLGGVLVGAPALSLALLTANVAFGLAFGEFGSLPVVLPFSLAMVVLGRDLWTRTD